MRLLHLDEVDSTQRVARAEAEAGAPHGTVVWAEAQTAGRGRLGRVWEAAPGENLLFTMILRPAVPPRDAPLLTLGAAAGMARTLGAWVKWPNDLVDAEGRKLGGLLAELETQGHGEEARVRYVLLGVGLNVNQAAFPAELPNATSLALRDGAPLDRAEVLERVVDAALGWATNPARLELWRERAHTLGRRVRVGGLEGLATALRDDGALIVGGVAVTTGEVELVRGG